MGNKLIIGVGNPIREDDGLGWVVVQELRDQLTDSDVNYIIVQQLTLDLVPLIADAESVCIIDVCKDGTEGRISRAALAHNSCNASTLTHFFSPHTLLSVVQSLYGSHPKAILFTVSAKNFSYSEDVSPIIKSIIPELISQISNEILLENEFS